jgi:toxin CptA
MEMNVGAARGEHKYSEAPVRAGLGPSRYALSCLVVMACASVALVAVTPGPVALRILAATAVACASLEAIHATALRRDRRGVRALILRRSREIDVGFGNGRWLHGVVRDGSFVAPWLTIVRWRPEGARFDRSIVLLPGMLPGEEFRQLRVLLRWSY